MIDDHIKHLRAYVIGSIFLIFSCFINQILLANELPQTGTLVVTYQTDTEGERLDRIRFWLKDEHNKQQLFPKGDAYVDDFNYQNRMVVIEDLLPGVYTLEFLVPNTDAYFVEVPIRQVVIDKGDALKIDQQIKPRTTFFDSEEKEKETETESPTFSDIDTPVDTEQTITADKTTQDVAVDTETAMGKLIVSFDAKFDPPLAEQICFKLMDDCGNCTVHPRSGKDTEVALVAGKMVMIEDVPVGEYSVEFFIEDDHEQTLYASKPFHITENKTKSLHRSLQEPIPHQEPPSDDPSSSTEGGINLNVTANIPTAIFHVRNEDRTKSWEGKGRLYTFEELEPGIYYLSFESTDPFFIPPKEMRIEMTENGDREVETLFQTQGKLKILTNVDYTKVIIEDQNHQKEPMKAEISETMSALYLPEGHYRLTFPKQDDVRVPPQPMEVTIYDLQTSEVNAYFEVQ
ncbi:MAG: hypothetical protein K940chlam7_00078 [Chlamydiae bacterium]|nr:hypothetical protein [Chlamydiota bacterium]